MEEKDRWRLGHIVEAIEYIKEFLKGVDKKTFFNDYKLQSALVRQFEIIGEAANHLSAELLKRYPDVDWREAIGMRHVMIHDYFAINLDVLWDTIENHIPILKKQIEKILKEL